MGLLDGMIGSALGGLLGGTQGQGQSPVLALVMQLVQQHGGVGGLLEKLRQGGLGQHVDSWVSTGENLPVSGEQLSQALGPELLGQLGGQLGLDPAQLGHGLAQVLPDLVNKMTPDGQVPPDHENSLLASLTGLLGGR
jgi:uncharacterized protein YidB (DUF937 family)